MSTFTCMTIDRRYTVPTLSFVEAADEDAARAIVRRDLAEHPDHEVIEVRAGDAVLFVEARATPETEPAGSRR